MKKIDTQNHTQTNITAFNEHKQRKINKIIKGYHHKTSYMCVKIYFFDIEFIMYYKYKYVPKM